MVMRKNYTALSYIGVCLLLDISEGCTNGLVAGNPEVQCMLRSSLLKGGHGSARMAGCPDSARWLSDHLTVEAFWMLMHVNEIGYCHIPTPTLMDLKGFCSSRYFKHIPTLIGLKGSSFSGYLKRSIYLVRPRGV